MDFTISRGDLRHFFPHNLIDLAIFPQSWDSSLNTGLGIFSANTLWITSYLNLTAFFGRLGLSWFQIEIIFWLIPILFLSFLGPFLLSSLFFEKKIQVAFKSYLCNKYVFHNYFFLVGKQESVLHMYLLLWCCISFLCCSRKQLSALVYYLVQFFLFKYFLILE